MYILIYTLLILFLGLGNKLVQTLSGSYGLAGLLADLPLILFTYFGLIALWGRAKDKKYFSKKIWQLYFCTILISIMALPFFEPSVQNMMAEFGTSKGLIAYGFISLIMLPYYFGIYSYSFGKNSVWKNA